MGDRLGTPGAVGNFFLSFLFLLIFFFFLSGSNMKKIRFYFGTLTISPQSVVEQDIFSQTN